MTVKEYLKVNNSQDISSVGIYSAEAIKDEYGRDTDILDVEVNALNVIKYLDREIDHVSLGIYDELKKDMNGGEYRSHHIRACIYVK